MSPTRLVLAALLLAAPAAARASSPEAWQAFRADVERSCTASLPEALASPEIYVEPTGTPSYGIALVEGLSPESKSRVTYVCAYDKEKQTVEVTPAIAAEFVHVLRESERDAIAREREATGDNRTVDESGGQ